MKQKYVMWNFYVSSAIFMLIASTIPIQKVAFNDFSDGEV